jgi:hypothetical protein
MDEITPLELALPKNSMASKEYLYGKEFTKLILQNWPKQIRNLKLILRCAASGQCKIYIVTKANRTFPIANHNFFWFEYDLISTKRKIHCVLM